VGPTSPRTFALHRTASLFVGSHPETDVPSGVARARLVLRFGTPEHGWLDVGLERRDEQGDLVETHGVDASDVPCDSLTQLADAGLRLLERRDEARVEWSLEPAYDVWLFRFTGEADLVELRIVTERPYLRFGADCPRGVPERFVVLPASEIAVALWRGLRRLESDPAWRGAEAAHAWSWAFPTEIVAALGRKLGR
jgi:hypothetical protein